MIKRIFDFTVALCGLVAFVPIIPFIALAIKLDSPGPVFFRQERMGKGFRPFNIYKFRTMQHSAAKQDKLLTIGNDGRVTRIGKTLRRLKLDELPQLLNILKGEMSFVGPRPEVPKYVDMFRNGFKPILTVRPGLTDLATLKYMDEQSTLGSFDNPEEAYVQKVLPEKIQLAELYVKRSSFAFDVLLLLETVGRLAGLKTVFLRGMTEVPYKSAGCFAGKPTIPHFVLKYRRPMIIAIHLIMIAFANYAAFLLRFDGRIPQPEAGIFLQMLPWAVVIGGLTFAPLRVYQGLWRYTGIWDLWNIIAGVTLSTLGFGVVVYGVFDLAAYPKSVLVIGAMLLIVLLGGIRMIPRIYRRMGIPGVEKHVLIVGAGDAGEMIVRDMISHHISRYRPIGFVDDDLSKKGQRIHGVRVLGTRDDLPIIMETYKPDEVLLAIPGANARVAREVVHALEAYEVPIRTLPSVRELLDDRVTMNQLRPLSIEDLLERAPVGLEQEPVRAMVAGKRVMVTGAGGSIGSELCRQVAMLEPAALILFERYENNLYSIANELITQRNAGRVQQVIGDVTDAVRVQAVMEEFHPHVVFHAAAHKHVPLMEYNPCEAVKNNVLGTQIVASAANHYGVEKFVLISTDKAVNPTSVMGATKKVAEMVVQEIAHRARTRFVTVRFGNVLGSNGSVVPRFLEQIKAGGPVTITHPKIRRFFMLIPEAVHLVLEAATLGEQGAIYVLEMGEQIKLVDMARHLIRLSGFVPEKEIPITFIGLRPGEKLFEELVGRDEIADPVPGRKIVRIQPTETPDFSQLPKQLRELAAVAGSGVAAAVINKLREIVPTFEPVGLNGTAKHLDGIGLDKGAGGVLPEDSLELPFIEQRT